MSISNLIVTTGTPGGGEPTESDQTAAKFLRLMMDRFETSRRAWEKLYRNMESDMRFRASEIWAPGEKADRMRQGRPCLDINRIPQFIRQVTNQQRASRPAIQVNPVDGGADIATAEALQGVIRHIENDSDADVAYANGGEAQVTMGLGFWRVITQYAEEDSFDQVAKIVPIPNPLAVYVDPSCVLADWSDARYVFVISDMPKDEFRKMYGDSAAAAWEAFQQSNNRSEDWMPEGKVRVAEYYLVDYVDIKIHQVAKPSQTQPNVTDMVVIPDHALPAAEEMEREGWKVLKSRMTRQKSVKWALCAPNLILEGNDDKTDGRPIACKYIPVVPDIGDALNINGEIDLRGMVRDAKDPMRMYVFWASALTEIIALAPRAPYIGAEGQFEGHDIKWESANRVSYAYLEYKPISFNGTYAPPPQRSQFDPKIDSIIQAFRLVDNDLMAVMGLYTPSLGKSGPEQSGKAILARQHQGELGNSNFLDNHARAIRFTGRILLDMIPRIYGPTRVLRILGVDDKPKTVGIHVGAPATDIDAMKAAQGVENIYDISVGRYDVTISTGPQYASRRQEAVNAMLQLAQANPEMAPVFADLLVKNMDWPGAAEIASRLKAMVPPQALAAEAGPDGQPQVSPQEVMQLKQQLQQLQQQIQTDSLALASKERMAQADLESKERIASLQAQVNLIATEAKIQVDKARLMIDTELARLTQVSTQVHEATQAHMDRTHEAEMQDQMAKAAAQSAPVGA